MKMTLQEWAIKQYGQHAPCKATLCSWARNGNLFPQPQKIGRQWLIDPNAQYVETGQLVPCRPTLAQQKYPLIKRLMEANNGTPPRRKKSRLAA